MSKMNLFNLLNCVDFELKIDDLKNIGISEILLKTIFYNIKQITKFLGIKQ